MEGERTMILIAIIIIVMAPFVASLALAGYTIMRGIVSLICEILGILYKYIIDNILIFIENHKRS